MLHVADGLVGRFLNHFFLDHKLQSINQSLAQPPPIIITIIIVTINSYPTTSFTAHSIERDDPIH